MSIDFGGRETRKSAENEVTEEVKKNANPKTVILFNFIFPADGISIFIFAQKTKGAFFKVWKELIWERKA